MASFVNIGGKSRRSGAEGIRACREMGIKSVAVYSEADRDSLHVRFADEAVCIGPAASAQSLSEYPAHHQRRRITDADAIHPVTVSGGEPLLLRKSARSAKIKFIGPDADDDPQDGRQSRPNARSRPPACPSFPAAMASCATPKKRAHRGRIGYPVIRQGQRRRVAARGIEDRPHRDEPVQRRG